MFSRFANWVCGRRTNASEALLVNKIMLKNHVIRRNLWNEISKHQRNWRRLKFFQPDFSVAYDALILPVIVIGELRFGAYRSVRQSENLVKIDSLEMRCEIIEIESSIADFYGSIKAALAAKGTPIPENDIWIAACCIAIDAPLLTSDRHFKEIRQLKSFFIK